ncbi:MAG: adenosylcobinamide-phosphate synthase CbiB [Gammaproteobacteria bacterium]|nr:adenosylcobinamide-phosphate synthase CbiB [Gammaproteobacteria bacterium]
MSLILSLIILIAVFLDFLLGEPKRFHPLAGFGRLAVMVEGVLYGARQPPAMILKGLGIIAWFVLVLPFVYLAWWLSSISWLHYLVDVALLYLALGAQSLGQHARHVALALNRGSLQEARQRVGMMVSRDSTELDETAIARATIESVLENGCDAVFGTLFWFIVLGAPGVVLYRLANTLDAMWGYRNTRYQHFGWAVARIDDLLNWAPARLTALTYILIGKTRQGWRCWVEQSGNWYGLNPGVVMTSGAGALSLTLGGPAPYHGMIKERPIIGTGETPAPADIERAVLFIQRGLWLWLLLIFAGGWLFA